MVDEAKSKEQKGAFAVEAVILYGLEFGLVGPSLP